LGGGKRVGILGGSFNPAHEGHLHISRHAFTRLDLDSIWWMVSPLNPLKDISDVASLSERIQIAKKVAASEKRIKITDIEQFLGTRYTIDTIKSLRETFPENQFVWIMGADNLKQLPEWKNWSALMETIPIAVFDRAPYSASSLASRAAKIYAPNRIKPGNAQALADHSAPSWIYLTIPRHSASGTQLRSAGRAPKYKRSN
jgi:nicotinate-nucleotide adenylyltransferase